MSVVFGAATGTVEMVGSVMVLYWVTGFAVKEDELATMGMYIYC